MEEFPDKTCDEQIKTEIQGGRRNEDLDEEDGGIYLEVDGTGLQYDVSSDEQPERNSVLEEESDGIQRNGEACGTQQSRNDDEQERQEEQHETSDGATVVEKEAVQPTRTVEVVNGDFDISTDHRGKRQDDKHYDVNKADVQVHGLGESEVLEKVERQEGMTKRQNTEADRQEMSGSTSDGFVYGRESITNLKCSMELIDDYIDDSILYILSTSVHPGRKRKRVYDKRRKRSR